VAKAAVWLWLHATLVFNCLWYKGIEGPFMIIQASCEILKDLFKRHTSKGCHLAQLDLVLYKWFTAICSEGNPVNGTSVMGLFMMQLK
jgi:hypothetical protein